MKLLARLSGPTLRSLARAALTPVGARAAYEVLRSDYGVAKIPMLPASFRAPLDDGNEVRPAAPPRAWTDQKLPPPGGDAWAGTTERYQDAYRRKAVSPTEVASRAISLARDLARRTPTLGPFHEMAETDVLRAAEESERRYAQGRPLSPFDGVPIAIKEEIAVRGLARQVGTSFLDASPQAEDGTLVARLRAAGALVLGTTPMTELGLSPLGVNPWRRMPRNPHRPDHVAGGSSTGSGVAVATGLVPLAIGCDGGGSIRIPASLVGIFGLKPTWGRVSRYGQLVAGTVEHFGPLASSTLDLARALDVIAGTDDRDAATEGAPPPPKGGYVRALGRGVKGLRVGILDTEWRDASGEVGRACEGALRALEREGALLKPLSSEMLRYAATLGYLIFPMGVRVFCHEQLQHNPSDFGPDVLVTMAALSYLSAIDYMLALEMRAGLRNEMTRLLREVDVLALPTTAITAPHATADEHDAGLVDGPSTRALCRFNFLANLTGLPAASVPVGKDSRGLPIGFQIVGDAWDEASVLAVAAHLERIGMARAPRPGAAVETLPS